MSSTTTTWSTDTNTKSGSATTFTNTVSTLKLLAAEGEDAILQLFADEGDDNADHWRIVSKASNNKLNFMSYASGAWSNVLSLLGHGTASSVYLALPAASKLYLDGGGTTYLQESSDGHLEINSGTTLDMTAPTVDINSSTELNIDTAAYDLNASGAITLDGATVTIKGTGASKYGDDTATLDFDGAGAVSETGMTTYSLTPSGAITLTAGAASTWSTSAGALTISGLAGVNIQENGSNIIVVDTSRNVQTYNTAALTLDCSGAMSFNSSGGAINIGSDDIDQAINIGTQGERTISIGTGSFADEVVIGNTTGASGVHLLAGTGDVQITGNLGIGVAAPDGTLHVHTATGGSITPSTPADDLIVENDADGGISILTPDASWGSLYFGSPSDNDFAWVRARENFGTNVKMEIGTNQANGYIQFISGAAADAMTIDSVGNVGIGETAPDQVLHIKGASGSPQTSGTTQGGVFRMEGANSDSLDFGKYSGSPYAAWIQGADVTALGTTYPIALNPNGGNVGIGETAPLANLHVRSSALGDTTLDADYDEFCIESSGNTGMTILSGTSNYGTIAFGDTDVDMGRIKYYHTNNEFQFYTNNSGDPSMVIADGGEVGIGTSAPGTLLEVRGGTGTGFGGAGILTLSTSELTIANGTDDVLGAILFQAPLESDGSPDGILPSAGIWATAEQSFHGSDNSTSLHFATAASETAKQIGNIRMTINAAGNVGIGLEPTANMVGLSVEAGCVTLKERATPTADTNYGKIYTKTDNKLYFQDGAGTEHEISFA